MLADRFPMDRASVYPVALVFELGRLQKFGENYAMVFATVDGVTGTRGGINGLIRSEPLVPAATLAIV